VSPECPVSRPSCLLLIWGTIKNHPPNFKKNFFQASAFPHRFSRRTFLFFLIPSPKTTKTAPSRTPGFPLTYHQDASFFPRFGFSRFFVPRQINHPPLPPPHVFDRGSQRTILAVGVVSFFSVYKFRFPPPLIWCSVSPFFVHLPQAPPFSLLGPLRGSVPSFPGPHFPSPFFSRRVSFSSSFPFFFFLSPEMPRASFAFFFFTLLLKVSFFHESCLILQPFFFCPGCTPAVSFLMTYVRLDLDPNRPTSFFPAKIFLAWRLVPFPFPPFEPPVKLAFPEPPIPWF